MFRWIVQRTILEIWSPCLPLVPCTSNVVDAPLDPSVGPRRDGEGVLDNSHCLYPCFENVRYCGRVSYSATRTNASAYSQLECISLQKSLVSRPGSWVIVNSGKNSKWERTYNPLLSSSRILFSCKRSLTLGSRHSSIIAGAHALRTWTGSSGSSHHPSISPEWALFGLLELPPSANVFFQFVEV